MLVFKALIVVVEAGFKFCLATTTRNVWQCSQMLLLATYTVELWQHLPSNGQFFFFLQLHGGMVWLALALLFNNILLCFEMIVAMLGIQLYFTLTFLLQILCKW